MKRILITRPRAQASDFAEQLRARGYEPIFFPVIEIRAMEENVALERALSRLDCYDWMVFTSANAVGAVLDRLPRSSFSTRVAAVGPKTEAALAVRGVKADFVPQEYIAEAILGGLGDLRGKWVLMPRAEIARKELPEAIFEAGGVPHEIAVYQTLPAQPEAEGLAALRAGVDVVTFTSASTAHNFAAIVRRQELDLLHLPGDPLFACIGPLTERAAREEGIRNLVIAREYSTEGLIDVISNLEVS